MFFTGTLFYWKISLWYF